MDSTSHTHLSWEEIRSIDRDLFSIEATDAAGMQQFFDGDPRVQTLRACSDGLCRDMHRKFRAVLGRHIELASVL